MKIKDVAKIAKIISLKLKKKNTAQNVFLICLIKKERKLSKNGLINIYT